MQDTALSDITSKFPTLTVRESGDCPAFNCPVDNLVELMTTLKGEGGYDMLMDVTAVDWHVVSPRFSVVYHLFSTQSHEYVRIVTDCKDDINPSVPSLVPLWSGADWHERETYDMFGIKFEGHPNLRRILMWDSYPYFPLRKEFPLAGFETEFPAADVAAETGVTVQPAPMMGGPFRASQDGPMSEREPRAQDESWTEHNPKPEEGK